MRIGGLLKFSLVDYPGKVAAVIFTQGCNFRCRYCYNNKLVLPECFESPIPEETVFDFLKKRKEVLQGVVVTGGEPAIQKDLIPFLKKIKELGYPVKLDTNGSLPHVLDDVISAGAVDFIAMDIKAPLARYAEVSGVAVDIDAIRESVNIILDSGIEHLFRTTIVPSFFSQEDFSAIASLIEDSPRYILQNFFPRETVLDKTLVNEQPYPDAEFDELQKIWTHYLPASRRGGRKGRKKQSHPILFYS